MTPSFLLSKAVAIKSPITSSLLEIEAICLILSESVPTTFDCFASQYNSTALSIPRFKSIDLLLQQRFSILFYNSLLKRLQL
jgi:hypothetical protein